jgi:predicted N-acyltransferase
MQINAQIEILSSLSEVDPAEWNALTDGSPILSHDFLSALAETECVGAGTGWQPYPVIVRTDQALIGAMPLYLKGHSYGEYVFDWAWADVFERYGYSYYPKLLIAIPFTPATGPRLLSPYPEIRDLLAEFLVQQMKQHSLSSAHVLFTDDSTAETLQQAGWLERNGIQFRWENEGFKDFEDFLSRLSHDKRKKIRQERKKILAAGVQCRRLRGDEISSRQWDFFYRCYVNTYREHHSSPYLTRDFFTLLGERLPQNVLMVLGEQHGEPIAAALNFYGGDVLYGRYWGATYHIPGLHFELCYYQAQEFCIEQGLRYFEGGAQGEHKLARGFKPRPTRSFHKIANAEFETAIQEHLNRETRGIDLYHHELEERAPFKKPGV